MKTENQKANICELKTKDNIVNLMSIDSYLKQKNNKDQIRNYKQIIEICESSIRKLAIKPDRHTKGSIIANTKKTFTSYIIHLLLTL